MVTGRIPILDRERFLEGNEQDRREVAYQVDATYRSIGFLIVRGHRVPPDLIARSFEVARRFSSTWAI
jgi:isopenicillin N synthase-like dioxygenase